MNSDPFERFINDKIDFADVAHIKPIDIALNLDLQALFMLPPITTTNPYAMREQLQQQFRERIQYMYGAQFVAEADAFAQAQGIDFVSAVNALKIRDAITYTGEAVRASFERLQAWISSPKVQAVMKSIGTAMADMQNGIEDDTITLPANRRERRAAKHDKPMKDGDQQWKCRDFRNHRKH